MTGNSVEITTEQLVEKVQADSKRLRKQFHSYTWEWFGHATIIFGVSLMTGLAISALLTGLGIPLDAQRISTGNALMAFGVLATIGVALQVAVRSPDGAETSGRSLALEWLSMGVGAAALLLAALLTQSLVASKASALAVAAPLTGALLLVAVAADAACSSRIVRSWDLRTLQADKLIKAIDRRGRHLQSKAGLAVITATAGWVGVWSIVACLDEVSHWEMRTDAIVFWLAIIPLIMLAMTVAGWGGYVTEQRLLTWLNLVALAATWVVFIYGVIKISEAAGAPHRDSFLMFSCLYAACLAVAVPPWIVRFNANATRSNSATFLTIATERHNQLSHVHSGQLLKIPAESPISRVHDHHHYAADHETQQQQSEQEHLVLPTSPR